MKKTKTFKLEEHEIEYVNNVISKWLKDNPGKYESDWLINMCTICNKNDISESKEISILDKQFIRKVNCELLGKENNVYVCYLSMKKASKKPTILGSDENIVYQRCMACKALRG